MKKTLLTAVVLSAVLLSITGCSEKEGVTPAEAKEIAREAYIYGFPIVVNYKTMYMSAVNEQSPEYNRK